MHSVFHPGGPLAQPVSTLWWWMLAVAGVVYALVMGAVLVAIWRRRRSSSETTPGEVIAGHPHRVPAVAALATACIVAAFAIYGVAVGMLIDRQPQQPLAVTVVGHQWWWEVVYPGQVTTANELHVPAGQPVEIALRSADVIHSFWVPSLAGKRDVIPGHATRVVIQVDTPGVYRGQCSQFCGLQHAHMALFIVAESPRSFEEWLVHQRQPALAPLDTERARGRAVFLSARCGTCHTVTGVVTLAAFGPNLTHLASRTTIAAGTLDNHPAGLAAWIRDPQQIKPGATMPANPMAPADLQALVAYLGSLR